MAYQMRFALALFLMLAGSIAFIFFFITTQTRLDYVSFEGGYEAECTNESLVLLLHSLERGKVDANNITVFENNASCVSNVPYYIFNTRAVVNCVGNFSGEEYTLFFDNRVLKINC